MEEFPINFDQGETENIINYEPIKLKQNDKEYNLNIKSKGEMITFSINVKKELLYDNYIKKISFKEIKKLNKVFLVLNSFNEFYDYLKSSSNKGKLDIKIYKDKITIIIYLEVLFKQENAEIDLLIGKQDIDLNMEIISKELLDIKGNKIQKLNKLNEDLNKEINNLKNKNEGLNSEINNLKQENEKLNEKIKNSKKEEEQNQKKKDEEINKKFDDTKNEISLSQKKSQNEFMLIISIVSILILSIIIYNLKNENKSLNKKIEDINKELSYILFKSSIMKLGEANFIFSEIEKRMNKSIKGLNKLYQASIDGGDPRNFHQKCDNIKNTLVLIKSEGKRRFGGFTPIPWKSKGGFIEDKKNQTFVFSLDNKKIYNLISIYQEAVYHHEDYGPRFGWKDIIIEGNPIENYKLRSIPDDYDYNGDKHPLSESDDSYNNGYIKALEYEVFEVLFD